MRILLVALYFTLFAACGDGESGLTGDSCDDHGDCEMGFCLEELGRGVAADPITFDGGYCSYSCNIEADGTTSGCGVNEICLIYDADGPFEDTIELVTFCAIAGCQTDHDCRDETYICQEFGSGSSACIPFDAVSSEERRLPSVTAWKLERPIRSGY